MEQFAVEKLGMVERYDRSDHLYAAVGDRELLLRRHRNGLKNAHVKPDSGQKQVYERESSAENLL